jgi:hypothetical protein
MKTLTTLPTKKASGGGEVGELEQRHFFKGLGKCYAEEGEKVLAA